MPTDTKYPTPNASKKYKNLYLISSVHNYIYLFKYIIFFYETTIKHKSKTNLFIIILIAIH